MDNWSLKGVHNLVKVSFDAKEISPTQVKVKITHVLISNFDALVFNGDISVDYPRTLGRFAVGLITDVGEKCYGVKKGDRVYLESAKSCGACFCCKSGKKLNCDDILIAGKDFDGYMRDFVICEYKDVSPLPDGVDYIHALCIEMVAIAENIFDQLNLSAGQRVAVIGSDCLGNIIAQVLQYHKVIPIVIDNNANNLDKIKKCGVYYAFPADESIVENVMDATSGDLCDAAIYSASSALPLSLPPKLVAKKKSIIFSGFTSVKSCIDMADILQKDLTISGINCAANRTDSAINMMLHGAINTDCFNKEIINQSDPITILNDISNNIENSNKGKLTILKMVF